jgi:hypothetical protein
MESNIVIKVIDFLFFILFFFFKKGHSFHHFGDMRNEKHSTAMMSFEWCWD